MIYGESSYILIRTLLFKGLALTYFIAFLVALRQYTSLVGENGILPISDIDSEERPWTRFSLFYFIQNDRFIELSALTGLTISLLTLAGLTTSTTAGSVVSFSLMWFLFLSFVNSGQTFYSYGWETILLESGFLAIFLGGTNAQTSEIVIWLFRWTLFRLMIGSALIKLRNDGKWRKLTALNYHFETQPLPNPLSRFFHNLPDRILKTGTFTAQTVLIIAPLLYFLPQPLAAIGGVLTIIYQLFIFLGGNYGWLNLITSVLALSTFNDQLFSFNSVSLAGYPMGELDLLLLGFIAIMSYRPVMNLISSGQVQNQSYSPFHLVNSYGTFSDVPEERREIVLEAYIDGCWKEYEFRSKPGPVDKASVQVSPYVHRLDYPFWFLAQSSEDDEWLRALLKKLLEGDWEGRKLFREYPEGEPDKVRARIFRYEFGDEGSDSYWERNLIEELMEIER